MLVMPMPVETLRGLLTAALPGARVDITDLAGDNDHYRVVVTSAAFTGKSRVAQHKIVYAALNGQMGNALHALTIETRIPEEI